tara:strand:+ start:111544 stop:111936 length:393 start_codon:yes stop_codon:yes gene_type:complete
MWKEELPMNCPPESAEEMKISAYRILKEEEPQESDFLPYIHLYPNNSRYKSLCEAFALSFFDSIQNAKAAWKKASKRGKVIGGYIGKIQIEPSDGKNNLNKKTGHISTWLYNTRANNLFECTDINPINGN